MPPLDDAPLSAAAAKRAGCATWLMRLFVVGVALVVAAAGLLRYLVASGRIPAPHVLAGPDLHERVEAKLRALELQDGEEVLHFYSRSLTDFAAHGSLLTDQRVVGWLQPKGEERAVDSVALAKIARIDAEFASHTFEDSTLDVYRSAGGAAVFAATLILSNKDGGDHRFVEELVQRARAANAPLDEVTVTGDLTAEELNRIPGATRRSRAPE